MTSARKKHIMSIRTRIAGGFMLLLAFIFILLAISFNRLVSSYIERQAMNQLGIAQENLNRDVFQPRMVMGSNGRTREDFKNVMPKVNNTVRRATFLNQVQALVIDDSMNLVYPIKGEQTEENSVEYAEKQVVYDAILKNQIDIGTDEVQYIESESRNYYVTVLDTNIPLDDEDATYNLVLYMDMTDVSRLARMINLVLIVVIIFTALIAAAVSLYMSNRISRPILELSSFAEAIGKSNFSRRDIDCNDRELIELADTMNHTAERLEKYDKEQKTFFQNVSHELRTPLMSIKGYAEGIKVGVFEDNGAAATIIGQESDHLTKMVEELLYLSKIDNITEQDEQSVHDIRELLSSCGEALRGVAIQKRMEFVYDFPDDAVPVYGSETALERAFSNLLTNAIRYGEKTVTIRCSREGDYAITRVEDDGPGIAEEDMPNIFNRFYKGRGGKHGIGLSIVKAVIGQHAGEVAAENMLKGAAFTIRLPIV